MATNENSTSSNNQTVDIPLYTQAKLTRKQAIDEIGDVILRSNMKPQTAQCALQLIQKLLPVDNTLPTTIDELFGAMLSSENDWRLAQYFIKHNQSPSFLPSSATDLFSIEERECNSTPLLRFIPFDGNESSSSSDDDEPELSPYDRLQQCLQPIMGIPTHLSLNYVTALHSHDSNDFRSTDQRSQLASNSIRPCTIHESIKRLLDETSSTESTDERDPFHPSRILAEFAGEPEDDDDSKSCCFEVNGHDLLNGGKRRRYH